jgi:pilus assembly protein FimV
MARKINAVVLSLGCLQASSVAALGLGELTMESFLNEPLRAKVDLLNTGGLHEDQIKIRLATRDDFEKLGVDRAYFLTSLKFEVEMNDSGSASIRVSSEDPVREPYLDFIVEARWPSGRLLREYTVLVDPPAFDASSPVVSASRRVEEVEGIPDPAKKKSEAPAASGGTRVDVRRSGLAPGAMPQRDYNAEAQLNPAPGSRYMIRRDDTLWEVASRAKPAGVSVHQTMLDIQRLNPDAFIDGNINRVKAGYIVYLPGAGDISSDDEAAALEEVRRQNRDWREGRVSQSRAATGPSLRISADEGDAPAPRTGEGAPQTGGAAAVEDLEGAESGPDGTAQRLAAMEQQVETLQRIVSLKDDQIAALQEALAEAGGSGEPEAGAGASGAGAGETGAVEVADSEPGSAAGSGADDVTGSAEAADEEVEGIKAAAMGSSFDEGPGRGAEEEDSAAGMADGAEGVKAAPAEAEEEKAQQAVAAKPAAPQPKAAPARSSTAPAAASGGPLSYVLYGLGALVLAFLGFLFLRRRTGEHDEEPAAAAVSEDLFADVELQDETLELEPAEELPEPAASGARGYGERKHDEYASDVDTGDALAEADIYIAYGRYPQAIELLRNAIAHEPGNPGYRLKLLEILTEMGDRDGAEQQLAELEAIDDRDAVARAREVLAGTASPNVASIAGRGGAGPDQGRAVGESLQSNFDQLEIEEPLSNPELAGELDLSADFGADRTRRVAEDDEELVIATEANGISTKLDLARAYLDMGDDEGARQILEEVLAEGSDEQRAEACILLERVG